MQRQATGVTEGERAQVLDEPVERPRLIAQQREMGVVARVDAVELRLDLGLSTASGVRNSWVTSARNRRRAVSEASRRPAMSLNAEPSVRTARGPAGRTRAS